MVTGRYGRVREIFNYLTGAIRYNQFAGEDCGWDIFCYIDPGVDPLYYFQQTFCDILEERKRTFKSHGIDNYISVESDAVICFGDSDGLDRYITRETSTCEYTHRKTDYIHYKHFDFFIDLSSSNSEDNEIVNNFKECADEVICV